MKKLIFILLLAVPLLGVAQVDKATIMSVKDSVALVADTTIVNKAAYVYNYKWIVLVETFVADATDATVKIQFANDTTATTSWVDYATNSTLTLNSASGAAAFEGETWLPYYMRVITIPGSVTSGEYRLTVTRFRNR